MSPGLTTWVRALPWLESACLRAGASLRPVASLRAWDLEDAGVADGRLGEEAVAVESSCWRARAMAALADSTRAWADTLLGSGEPISSVVADVVDRGAAVAVVAGRERAGRAADAGGLTRSVDLELAQVRVVVGAADAGVAGLAVGLVTVERVDAAREEEVPDVDTSSGSVGRVLDFAVPSIADVGPLPYHATRTTNPKTDNSRSAFVPAVIFDASVHHE